MISLEALDEARQKIALAPLTRLSNAMVVRDTKAVLDFMYSGSEPVRRGAIGSIGYCMGGRHVMRVAAEFPDRITASASLHGTLLVSAKPDSAHLTAHRIRGEFYCGFAEHDDDAPPATIAEVARRMEAADARYRHEVHPGAVHGYSLPDRDIHDRQATGRDWELIFAMFQRQIPPYGGRVPAR